MSHPLDEALAAAQRERPAQTETARSVWEWLRARLANTGSDDPFRTQSWKSVEGTHEPETWSQEAEAAVEALLAQPGAVYPVIVAVLSESIHTTDAAFGVPSLFGLACVHQRLPHLARLALERAFDEPQLLGPHAFGHLQALAEVLPDGTAEQVDARLKALAAPFTQGRQSRERDEARAVFLEGLADEASPQPHLETPTGLRVLAELRQRDPELAARVEAAFIRKALPGGNMKGLGKPRL